jgi:formamidopyrimidine-DNA glycosylase
MLELPEIETLKRDLERDAVGRKFKSVDIKVLKTMPGHRTKKSFTDLVEGAKITAVERQALALILHLSNEHSLIIELHGAGHLTRVPSKDGTESGTICTFTFTQGGDLRVVDPGADTTIAVVPTEEVAETLPNAGGIDLLAKPISWVLFQHYMKGFSEPLKAVLTDPSVFVGIGNIYSDEILFDSGLRYDRPANELSTQELRRLYRSVVGILYDAIKYRGVSIEERPFIDLTGAPGEYGDHLSVYGKAGQLSPRSRIPIEKAQFRGTTVYYCTTQV